MPNIAPVDTRNAGPARDVLDTVRQKLGTVPNLLATMAHSPAALEFYLAAGTALDNGVLGGQLREKIALTVAGANKCDYCASAHTFLARSLGIDEAEAMRNLAGESSDSRTQSILTFVRDVVRDRARMADNASELNRLRNNGVTDEEIVEIVANVTLNIYTNYLNHIADTHIDFPPVSADAAWAAAS
jgi:uncharacterized peroxidase-related enzyme